MSNPNQYSPEEIAFLEAKAEETRRLQFEMWMNDVDEVDEDYDEEYEIQHREWDDWDDRQY